MKIQGLYYFAHPLTCRNDNGDRDAQKEETQFRLCCVRSAELLKRGFNVYSPIAHTYPIQQHCLAELAWYDLDHHLIAHVDWDGIILAPGWDHSVGCRGERQLFATRRLTILHYEDIIRAFPILEDETAPTPA